MPLFIQLSTVRLRKFSTVLRIHSSSKKGGQEELFAEMQLFSPWRAREIQSGKDDKKCLEQLENRQEIINALRRKIFPFSMNQLIEESQEE